MNELGAFIKEQREKNGKSLRTMAKDIGISSSYLSDIETGNRPILTSDKSTDLVKMLSNYFNLSEEEHAKLINLGEIDLNQRGKLSNEIKDYMNSAPMASIALRTAKKADFDDKDWENFINQINNKK